MSLCHFPKLISSTPRNYLIIIREESLPLLQIISSTLPNYLIINREFLKIKTLSPSLCVCARARCHALHRLRRPGPRLTTWPATAL